MAAPLTVRGLVTRCAVAHATEEDLLNSMGVSASDDRSLLYSGREACSFALQQSVEEMRPLLARLFTRLVHVLERMLLYAKQAVSPRVD